MSPRNNSLSHHSIKSRIQVRSSNMRIWSLRICETRAGKNDLRWFIFNSSSRYFHIYHIIDQYTKFSSWLRSHSLRNTRGPLSIASIIRSSAYVSPDLSASIPLQIMGRVIVIFSRDESTRCTHFPGMFISGDSIVELLRGILWIPLYPLNRNPVRRMKIRLRFDKPRYRQESRRVMISWNQKNWFIRFSE